MKRCAICHAEVPRGSATCPRCGEASWHPHAVASAPQNVTALPASDVSDVSAQNHTEGVDFVAADTAAQPAPRAPAPSPAPQRFDGRKGRRR